MKPTVVAFFVVLSVVLNAAEYKTVHKQMYENYLAQYPNADVMMPSFVTSNTGVDTDWQDTMLRNGISQNYMLSETVLNR